MSKAKMLPIESLEKYLAKQLPQATLTVDKPKEAGWTVVSRRRRRWS